MINKIKKISIKSTNCRFAPDPNGYLHIGHVYNVYVNYCVSLFKNGFFFLRFDNTNLTNFNLYYYFLLSFDLLWLGIKWSKKKNFLNDYHYFIIILCYYLKKKKIFLKKNIFSTRLFFNYLNYKKIMYFFLFKNNFFLKKNIIFMLKKKIIFRKKNRKKNFLIFPTYDFTQSFNDFFNKINISVCTKEFVVNSLIYNYLIKKLINKPFQIEFEKKNIINNKLSKRKLKKKYYFNIFYLRKIGLTKKKIFYLCNNTGISDKISYLKYKIFINCFKIENNNIVENFYFLKFLLFNIKKNLLFNIIINKKNINLYHSIFFLKKKIKINFVKINFIILNNFILINKKIFFKNFIIFKKKYFLIKKIIINKQKNYYDKKNHCLYDSKIVFKKSIINK